MHRRATVLFALVGVAAAIAGPAQASVGKSRTTSGSYTVTAPPDPTMEATSQAGKECFAVNPSSRNDHPFTVPGRGTLHVVLDSANVAGHTDWDLYIVDKDGGIIDSSHGATAHEETTDRFKTAQPVFFRACNLLGEPTATVTWTFQRR
jgi:hypothetical protein